MQREGRSLERRERCKEERYSLEVGYRVEREKRGVKRRGIGWEGGIEYKERREV